MKQFTFWWKEEWQWIENYTQILKYIKLAIFYTQIASWPFWVAKARQFSLTLLDPKETPRAKWAPVSEKFESCRVSDKTTTFQIYTDTTYV